MKSQDIRRGLPALLCCVLLLGFCLAAPPARAQEAGQGPLTRDEFLAELRQMPKRPSLKQQLINEIRQRGINFTLEPGLRSLVATKSGNDADLRHTLEEAERKFLHPSPAAVLPPAAEGQTLLERARAAVVEASDQMPDFVVKQLITRSHALGESKYWHTDDRLTVGVSYRVSGGEKYRVLALNGLPTGKTGEKEPEEREDYSDLGGTSSTGEFVTMLSLLFAPETQAQFKLVDTDTLHDRRTLVYEYTVEQPHSRMTIAYNKGEPVVVGYHGRVWIDRENDRVLRLESVATDLPPGFPVTAATRVLDYDWVEIAGRKYLLPAHAVLEMTARERGQTFQSRNEIRFRNYQKYGTEIKIIEEDIVDDESGDKPAAQKPAPQPVKKP